MSLRLLQIDTTRSSMPDESEDLIDLETGADEVIQVPFSKLVSQSKYVRDKYKYKEEKELLQQEMSNLQTNKEIKEKHIKHFIEYINKGRINIEIDEFKQLYFLSKHFQVMRLTDELERIQKKELLSDLTFSIQTLLDSIDDEDEKYSTVINNVEEYLANEINESICNCKFWELPVSIIYRLLDKCDKERLNYNVLTDHILESIEKRFILLKFVELHKMSDENINELIQNLDDQEETTKAIYSEYMQFNLRFIKEIINKFNQTKEELSQTKEELNQTKEELNQTKEELNQTNEELKKNKRRTKPNERRTKPNKR